MELINPTPPRYTPPTPERNEPWLNRSRSIYMGVVLILSGLVWLLYNLDVLDSRAFDIIFSWQMLMVVIGGYLISQRHWTSGGIVGGIGLVFLVTDLLDVYIPFGKVILPLVLISIGLAVLLDRRKW